MVQSLLKPLVNLSDHVLVKACNENVASLTDSGPHDESGEALNQHHTLSRAG